MTKRESEQIAARIASYIASQAPVLLSTPKETKRYLRTLAEGHRADLAERGLVHGDGEVLCVLEAMVERLGLSATEPAYLRMLSSRAKKLSMTAFYSNPYLKAVHIEGEKRIGRFLLTTQSYARGELLQYEMPDLFADPTVLSLGFFDAKVSFPTIYEDGMPWMSVCPSEISSMQAPIAAAHGKVLVLGLGLGYYPLMIAASPRVTQITVVELRQEVIALFERYILPQIPQGEKIHLVHGDALSFLEGTANGVYDFCFADIWEGAHDGAPLYTAIKAHDTRMSDTEFSYWIEEQIKAYLEE